ncbi:MAG: hypothetical protein HYU81_00865 [Candidatus Brennerbacteria bacterium]|nr:hypothetical protein [Candidatus Brennerbacteria bacterium]
MEEKELALGLVAFVISAPISRFLIGRTFLADSAEKRKKSAFALFIFVLAASVAALSGDILPSIGFGSLAGIVIGALIAPLDRTRK